MPELLTLPPVPVATPAARAAMRAPGRPAPAERFALHAAPSAIDGMGVFADEAIPPRAKIGEIRGEAISVAEARRRARRGGRLMLVEISDRRAVDASASTDLLRFANHSCRPNAALRIQRGRIEIYAQRDIAPGDEITLDYGETHHAGTLACRCGVEGCRGML
jgi:SET domain-containing protein